ncbi:MAG: hypothetical protein VKN33_04010 [Candidatus Sericytochromatia bacterium]|nr:hypothetical protein [Candidatus Sericytochromatia bacterium]
MALCAYHEDVESVAVCVACRSPVCATCRDFGADGMCGMCLEMAQARQAASSRERRPSAPASAPMASPKPSKPATPVSKAAQKAPPSNERNGGKSNTSPTTSHAASKKSRTGTLPKPPQPRAQAPRVSPKVVFLTAITGVVLALWFGAGPREEPNQRDEEIQEYMGRVKSAILAVQDKTGKLPENIAVIEDHLRRGGVDLELLRPPIYIQMDRSTKQANTILLTTVSDGIEIRGLNAKGKEVSYDNRPIILNARRRQQPLSRPSRYTYERNRGQ